MNLVKEKWDQIIQKLKVEYEKSKNVNMVDF